MSDIKELIETYIDSDELSLELPMTPVQEIEEILAGVGYEHSNSDQNGWQVDFWYTYTHPERGSVVLSGSLHYGGFAITKQEKDE